MNVRPVLLVCGIVLAAAVGCYTGSSVDTNQPPIDPSVDTNPTNPPVKREAGAAPPTAVTPGSGLPCDVAAVVVNACGDCHGATPSGGAPNRLTTYEDFKAPSDDDPSVSVASVALGRMKSSDRPMPPDGKLAGDTIAVFEKWVDAGLPKGSCEAPAPETDAAPPPDPPPPVDAGPAPSICTSGVTTSPDDPPSDQMNPGMSCISCHSDNDGPPFEIAGTVYPTLHEPDSCVGADGVTVLIIDRAGNVHTMNTNASGNFSLATSFPRPYRAMVIRGGGIRQMQTPQSDGNCNGCHTEQGDGAPGRVRAP